MWQPPEVTYRPGVEVLWDHDVPTGRWRLILTEMVQDSNRPEERVCKGVSQVYDSYMPMDQFLLRTFREFELHEVDEWLKIDGKRIQEPHNHHASTSS